MAKLTTVKVSATFLEELIRDYLSLTDQIRRMDAKRDQLAQQLRVALEVSPGKTASTRAGSASLVESDVVRYDPATLEAALSPETLALVSHPQIDKDRLEAAIAIGAVPAEIADRARRLVKRKPQLRVRQP
jgi:hypothetical protein